MTYLALTLPGGQSINAPAGIPTGGMSGTGASIVSAGIQLLLIVAIILSLGYLIYGGFKWMTSGGDQEKIAGARQTLIFAIVGLAITALSFLFIQTLGQFFGITTFLSVPNTN